MVWSGAGAVLLPERPDAELDADDCGGGVSPVCAIATEAASPRTAPNTAPVAAKRLNWIIGFPDCVFLSPARSVFTKHKNRQLHLFEDD
jgi:hypothetical protein